MSFADFLKTNSSHTICSTNLLSRAFVIKDLLKVRNSAVYLAANEEEAHQLYALLLFLSVDTPLFLFPAWDTLAYDRLSPSPRVMAERLQTLFALKKHESILVITTAAAIIQTLPPDDILKTIFEIEKSHTINLASFENYLSENGYVRSDVVRNVGEFSKRGSLIDLWPAGKPHPYRIDLFDNTVESIRTFDPISQRSEEHCDLLSLHPTSELSLNEQTTKTFRQQYRTILGSNGDKDPFYASISEMRFFPGMEHWLPLFYEKTTTFFDYLSSDCTLLADVNYHQDFKNNYDDIYNYYAARKSDSKTRLLTPPLDPQYRYISLDKIETLFKEKSVYSFTSFFQESFYKDNSSSVLTLFNRDKKTSSDFENLITLISENQNNGKTILICCYTQGSQDRIAHYFEQHNITHSGINNINDVIGKFGVFLTVLPIDVGCQVDNLIILSEQDIFGERLVKKTTTRKSNQHVLQEASSIQEDDYLVHIDHGIGQYKGLQTLTINNAPHDCLYLVYSGGDKLFVPVENMDVLSRFGSSESVVELDRLGSAAWQNRKARVKEKIRTIAIYLIETAAQRQTQQGDIVTIDSDSFDTFCARFPYPETQDQLHAIDDILKDFKSSNPMDRLVCGDVGFGKTEVAIRAAFAAAKSGLQVALVVPTTLLCRQHFENFQKRFSGTNLKVAQLSRLVIPKQTKQTKDDLEKGDINIVIATHAIFAKSIHFHNLGLVIIDEEQHFGVAQKERLKQMKPNVHVLALSATPIPRTLQMALTGIRQMSLITTPPVDRHAINTTILPFDAVTIKEAILREYQRGGQIFYVSPRTSDLSLIEERLKELVPHLKIATAHGKMPVRDLEKVMMDFEDHQFDILISTNIIESGIDVANANTMIIHRSDLFGLSQLYQLRGRIGRSKQRAFAYLSFEPEKNLSKNAVRRLEVMQTLDNLGAGFSLASHDLDIRGAGNLVGEEQSGHIREIGIELYQSMLEDALIAHKEKDHDLIAEKLNDNWSPQINLGLAVYLPDSYVSDLNLRLSLYKRLSHLTSAEEIDAFAVELVDRFGKLPSPVKNLINVMQIKILCKQANIEKIDTGDRGAVIHFKDNYFSAPDKLIDYISSRSVIMKIRPDQKIVVMQNWTDLKLRLQGVLKICSDIFKLTLPNKSE